MKKAAILTLYGYTNYGNRLQNYAVQEILKSYGFKVKTIVAYQTQKNVLMNIYLYFKALTGSSSAKRVKNMMEFSLKYIPVHFIIPHKGRIPRKISDKYDYFIVGSDQVWNPHMRTEKELYNFFLKFADEKQRICLSPSLGAEQIPQHEKNIYLEGLRGFQMLSVREQAGKEVISDLTGQKVQVLIDPTMALNSKEWERVMPDKLKLKVPGRYILTAFLGEASEDEKNYVELLSAKSKLPVVNVFDHNYDFAPGEILFLLKHAQLVCTDSFHFSAFSVNFNTPFISFERHGGNNPVNMMFSRIQTLLETFHLEDRSWNRIQEAEVFSCDFTNSNQTMQQERRKFFAYLDQALGNEKT